MGFRKMMKQSRSLVACGMALLLFGAVKQPMTAYAAGPGETQVTQQAQQIVSYGQAQVKALGSWEQQSDSRWKFKQFTGSYLTSSWIESQATAGSWYFVDANGYMLTSTTTPDGYYVDANGIWKATGGNGGSSSQQITQNNNNNGNQQTDNSSSNQNNQQENNNGGSDDTGSGNWWEEIQHGGGSGFGNNSPSLNQ